MKNAKIAACVLLLLSGCLLVNELAKRNYAAAMAAAAASPGTDLDNSEIMNRYGFQDSTGVELSEPGRIEKIQALIISL